MNEKKKSKYVHISAVTLTDLCIPNWMTLQKRKAVSLPLQNDLPMLSYKNIFQFEMHGCHNNISSHLLLITAILSVQALYQVRKWPSKHAFSTTS